MTNREKVERAFAAWKSGTARISDLFADELEWTIVGHSLASRTYKSKQEFIDEVLDPFAARFSKPFRPVLVRETYADGDTVIVLWDGEGTALDGRPYRNTYAWFMTLRDGLVVRATAFFDSIAFNDLWTRVTPAQAALR